MACVDLVGPFTIRKSIKKPSVCNKNYRSSSQTLVGLKLLKPQISQQHPSRICFITPGWHVTRDLNLLSLKNGGEFKRNFKQMCDSYGIKAKPTTTHKQMQSLSEYTKKVSVNDMLRILIWKIIMKI
jgi:hypothetical protein